MQEVAMLEQVAEVISLRKGCGLNEPCMNELCCTGSSGVLDVKFKHVCSALWEAACCNFQVVTFSLIIWKRTRPGTDVYSSF